MPVDRRRVAFVQSCWHRDIVDEARRAFDERIAAVARGQLEVDHFEVPGALELPLQVRLLAKSGHYAAVVAAGLIVDGGIYRHEFVAATVLDALMRIQLELELPVLSAVLTPQRFHEHEAHREFFQKHFVVKGAEVADACLGAVAGLERLRDRLAQLSGAAAGGPVA
jgi:6,7-dimethyl-8-ribityllumazine synthase